tara:strand:+ start:293 stop:628 length:336 start_codon:yes stop_codon:yes gene_type:complete
MAATPAINIVVQQGVDFAESFTQTETDGTLSNLVGYTGVSKLKKYAGSPTAYDFTVGINTITSKVSIAMTAPVTVNLKPGRYYYDIVLTSSTGAVSRMVEGSAMVTAGIST